MRVLAFRKSALALFGLWLVAVPSTASAQPSISVTPDSLYDSLMAGDSSTQTLTLSNSGDTSLTFHVTVHRVASATRMTPDEAVASLTRRTDANTLRRPRRPSWAPIDRAGAADGVSRAAAARVIHAAPAASNLPDVALVAADDPFVVADVADLLLASGRFGSVTMVDAAYATPTLAELNAFDAVMVWSDYYFADPERLGDTLATFVDAGGGVVCATFESVGDAGLHLEGRWESERYYLVERGSFQCCDNDSLGSVSLPAHPVMSGVVRFKGGNGAYRASPAALTAGSELVASWSDGTPLVTARTQGQTRRVDLGFYPPSSRLTSDFWQFDTDGGLLLANSLAWVAQSWLSIEPDSGQVPAGASLDLNVQFNAALLLGGDYNSLVQITSTDPTTPELTIPAYLHVTGVRAIEISDSALDFGNTFIGGAHLDTIMVSNVGTDLLTISSVTVSPADFSADTTGFSLSPGHEHALPVAFAPGATGPMLGSLTINSNDADHPALLIRLSGTGLEPPVISLSPDSLYDSLLSGESAPRIITITNTGTHDLEFYLRFHEPGGSDVALLGADYPTNVSDVKDKLLKTGQFSSVSTIDVRFTTPTVDQLRAFDAVLVWAYNSFSNRQTLGNALADYVDAGGGVVCAIFEVARVPLLGRWASDDYAVIKSNDYLCCNRTVLGTAAVPSHPLLEGVATLDGGYDSFRPFSTNLATGSTLVASWSDSMPLVATRSIGSRRRVDLGLFPPSSDADNNFWKSNTDGDRLMANALAWVSVPWLTCSSPSGTVPAGGHLDVAVTFDAHGIYGGDYLANIEVLSNDPITPVYAVPARLHVTGIPEITLADTSFDFGTKYVGTTSLDTLVVRNTGTESLTVSSIVSSAPEFGVDVTGFTLAPRAIQRVAVSFLPDFESSVSGNLVISSDDLDEPTVFVSLAGAGLMPPVASVAPDVLVDSLFIGESSSHLLTLDNVGGSDLQFAVSAEKISAAAAGAQPASVSAAKPRVAIVAASYDSYMQDVKNLLQTTGQFDSIGIIPAGSRTPSFAELRAWDAILVWSEYSYSNPTLLGNNLADYVDAGGGVVCAMLETGGSLYYRLRGRWESDSYFVFQRGDYRTGPNASLGEVAQPRHPIMAGVKMFEGGPVGFRPQNSGLTTGSSLVASWSDGSPLVATKEMAVARRVDLGFYPVSSRVRYEGWQVTSDGARLLANALTWVSSAWIEATPVTGLLPAGESVHLSIAFDAARLDPGDHAALVVIRSNDPFQAALEVETHLMVRQAVLGDCNGDGLVSSKDIIQLVNYIFKAGPPPRGQTGDFSCEQAVTVLDVIHLVNHVFKGATLDGCD